MLKFKDSGERDDKIVAVTEGSKLESVSDFKQLERDYPGTLEILETWFKNYKGAGVMTFEGQGSVDEANAILQAAIQDFKETASNTGKP